LAGTPSQCHVRGSKHFPSQNEIARLAGWLGLGAAGSCAVWQKGAA
jgi:hypothetical protein